MKRFWLGALTLAAVTGFVFAAPVRADDPDQSASLVGWLDLVGRTVENTVNPVLERVPPPDGWNQRSVCVGADQIDRAFCLYFPWPT